MTILVTRHTSLITVSVAFLFFIIVSDHAQQPPLSHAQDFSTDMYFKPPNEQLVETRLSGTNALPLPGGLLDVKKMKIEKFSTNGNLEITALADQCTYDVRHGVASSPGHLDLTSGDGVYRLEGDGFMFVWHTNATSLTVSNHVHTVIRNGILKL